MFLLSHPHLVPGNHLPIHVYDFAMSRILHNGVTQYMSHKYEHVKTKFASFP
jgi:hypothetical protein